jgi:creatinine amidohydrolase
MQVVRDISDEVERQGFTTMILLNGHGGNFALTPVVRDINRLDRRLKILLVPWYMFRGGGVLESAALGKPDIHAGEAETSVMLALRPDLVKPGGPDLKLAVKGFQQSDLTTFGVGYAAPQGAFGSPSLASRAKGEKLVASAKRNVVAHIRERLKWLAKNRNYSGKRRTRR